MRVGYIFICGCRMGVKSNTVIGSTSIQVAELVYLELNLKWAKINIF
jgi:hypothetical protein